MWYREEWVQKYYDLVWCHLTAQSGCVTSVVVDEISKPKYWGHKKGMNINVFLSTLKTWSNSHSLITLYNNIQCKPLNVITGQCYQPLNVIISQTFHLLMVTNKNHRLLSFGYVNVIKLLHYEGFTSKYFEIRSIFELRLSKLVNFGLRNYGLRNYGLRIFEVKNI